MNNTIFLATMNDIQATIYAFEGATLVCLGIKEACSKDASYKRAMFKTAAGVGSLVLAFMTYQAGVDAYKHGGFLIYLRQEGTFGEATAGEVVRILDT